MVAKSTHYVTGDAAFAVDKEGTIVCWNSAAERVFGHKAEDVLGGRCWKLFVGQDMYGNQYCCEKCPVMRMALKHEAVHSFHAKFKTRANGMEEFKINCLTIYDGPGNELLLHICEEPENQIEHFENHHAESRPSANSKRGALTEREVEVLALLAEGKTTKRIASLLCISYTTVRNHIHNILYKLHVHSRLEAVITGQRLNLF